MLLTTRSVLAELHRIHEKFKEADAYFPQRLDPVLHHLGEHPRTYTVAGKTISAADLIYEGSDYINDAFERLRQWLPRWKGRSAMSHGTRGCRFLSEIEVRDHVIETLRDEGLSYREIGAVVYPDDFARDEEAVKHRIRMTITRLRERRGRAGQDPDGLASSKE